MQFKDLFYKKNIVRFIILTFAIFLLLPLIFPEKDTFKIIKKESVYSHEDSPLPIFPKENVLDKYVNKLKKFYKMDTPVFVSSKQNKEKGKEKEKKILSQIETELDTENKDIDINASDLFFSTDFDEDTEINSSTPTQKDNSVNLQQGTVLTQDGMTLFPTQEGYYYNNKFYKNGTYPKNANKKYIEGALNRYHSRIAKNLGKKAVYFADEQGNLTVSYVNELPDEISTDIDTYLAQNRKQNNKLTQHRTYNRNRHDTYKNTRTDDNKHIDTSDVAIASIKDMHAAYNLANEKIKTGQIGQGIIQNPNHLIPTGNIALDQSAPAEEPIEKPEDSIFCQGNECANSLRVAPIISYEDGIDSSDLDLFYDSLCEDTCTFHTVYRDSNIAEKPLNLDFNKQEDIDYLKRQIEKSDKEIIEISYIHPSQENEQLLTSLEQMALTNKNGNIVKIRLRAVEKVEDNTSFGEKMVGPFKTNISKDLVSQDNIVSYDALVDRYNKVDENVQNNISENPILSFYKEFFPTLNFNPPVAFVEKLEGGKFFMINNPNIPKGYIDEIPQWEEYRQDDGSYKVPREVLFNPPSDLAIISVQEGKKRDIVLQDGHPVNVISKEYLQKLNIKDVEATKTYVADAQIKTIIFNAEKLDSQMNNGN